jgi:hypothetical protein
VGILGLLFCLNTTSASGNLALNKPVVVSTVQTNTSLSGDKAVDGNLGTRWGSEFSSAPQWLYVDLQKNCQVTKIVLAWETASAKDYRVEVSTDAAHWVEIAQKSGMAPGPRTDILSNLSTSGRYVRVYATARTNPEWGYSLFELQVEGSEEALTPYQEWQARNFTPAQIAEGAGAPLAAPGGDGVSNLVKYAIGWDSPFAPPPAAIMPAIDVAPDRQASFSFRSLGRDLTYTVETSVDLRVWKRIFRVYNPTSLVQMVPLGNQATDTSLYARLRLELGNSGVNQKNLARYQDRQVFLAPDQNWREVLTLLPVAIWTEAGAVRAHPLLICHQEKPGNVAPLDSSRFITPNGTTVTLSGSPLLLGQPQPYTMRLSNTTAENIIAYITVGGYPPGQMNFESSDFRISRFDDGTWMFYDFPLAAGESKDWYFTVTKLQDSGGVDADSILSFNRQYKTRQIATNSILPADLSTALSGDGCVVEHAVNPLDYWTTVDTVVYVEDDYETALLAATYASLINAPLLIEGYNDHLYLGNKHVIAVGDVYPVAPERYTLESLRHKYLAATATDKILITNPDLTRCLGEYKSTILPNNSIEQLFGGTSLAAPILAAARQELLLTVKASDSTTVDRKLEEFITQSGIKPHYLTILASPLEIEQTIFWMRSDGPRHTSIDNTRYGNLDNDPAGFAELKTGRIYGFTISDVSTYIARVLNYDKLPLSDQHLFIGEGVGPRSDEQAAFYAQVFNEHGLPAQVRTYAAPAHGSDWANKRLIHTQAHGSPWSTGRVTTEMLPELQNTFIIAGSCSLLAFDDLRSRMAANYFGAELIRKGAVGVIGATDTNGFGFDSSILNRVLNSDAGAAFKQEQNYMRAYIKWYHDSFLPEEPPYSHSDILFLLGDPLLQLGINKPIVGEVSSVSTQQSANSVLIQAHTPSYSALIDSTPYCFIDGMPDLSPALQSNIILKIKPVSLFAQYRVQSAEVIQQPLHSPIVMAEQREEDGVYIYVNVWMDLRHQPVGVESTNPINLHLQEL